MELARIIVLEIATVSHRIVGAATEYARRRGFRNVQSCHFRLEKEMQSISVAAGGILGVLSKSSLPNGPPLDDRLQEWFSTDELPTCLRYVASDGEGAPERYLDEHDLWLCEYAPFVTPGRQD
jgi:hypothetical protein